MLFVITIIVSRLYSQLLVQETYEAIIMFGTNFQIIGQQLAGLCVRAVNYKQVLKILGRILRTRELNIEDGQE